VSPSGRRPAPGEGGREELVNPFYQRVLLPPVRYLTRGDAEVAMDWHLRSLRLAQRRPAVLRLLARRHGPPDPCLAQELMGGLRFPQPVGIAAGLDKNAAVHPALAAHHAPGFIEVGTVTRRAQPGNPRPRIRRRGPHHLINAMGFPNEGVEAMVANLRRLGPAPVPLGVNIGKNKDSDPEQVAAEYAGIVGVLAEAGVLPDYVAVNVSSPNTPGLRDLQRDGTLAELLAAVAAAMESAAQPRSRRRLLVKLAPDLDDDVFDSLVAVVLRAGIGGLILTNTTAVPGGGGLSGPDLYPLSSRLVRRAAAVLPADRVIVATGGVDTVDRAYEMLRHADLIGAYTGLVLKGPGLLRHLSDGVAARMRADGVGSLPQLRAPNRPAAGTADGTPTPTPTPETGRSAG